MSSTRNQLPDRATAKPRPVKENKRRVLCLTCGKPIPAYQGVMVDDANAAPSKLRGYRHQGCPRPKSAWRDPHKLGQHVLRIKARSGDSLRVCAVRGCRYSELWHHDDWHPYTDTAGTFVSERDDAVTEPALANMPLFAS